MRSVATDVTRSMVCLSVCLLDKWVSYAKTAGAESRGSKEPCIRSSRDPRTRRGNFGGILGVVRPIEKHWESLLWCTQQRVSWWIKNGWGSSRWVLFSVLMLLIGWQEGLKTYSDYRDINKSSLWETGATSSKVRKEGQLDKITETSGITVRARVCAVEVCQWPSMAQISIPFRTRSSP